MKVHPALGPGLHPTEPVISKRDDRVNVITRDPIVHEVAAHFPEHDAAEEDAKENQE